MYQNFTDTKEYISLLLKGVPGTGKTTIAAQFPNVCIINFDKNLSCLRKLPLDVQKNIKVVNPFLDEKGVRVKAEKVWDNFTKLLAKVVEDAEVKTVVIDSLTLMASALEDDIIGTNNPKAQFKIQDWGTFGRYLKWLGENLIQAQDRDKNVIVIAHESVTTDPDTQRILSYDLSIGGKMKKDFEMYFSNVWKTYIETGVGAGKKFGYYVRTKPTNLSTCKCSLDLPDVFAFEEQRENIIKQLS